MKRPDCPFIIPLTGFSALSTAFADDVAPELTFAQLAWAMGKAGESSSESAPQEMHEMSAAEHKPREHAAYLPLV